MSKDKKSAPNDFSGEQTRVDLGEDLLETTTALPVLMPEKPGAAPAGSESSSSAQPRMSEAEAEDHLQSARILKGERIFDEAKRVLRRILLSGPERPAARKMLEEIHEEELKQIFGETETPRRNRRAERARPEGPPPEEVARELDRDLRLGAFDEVGGDEPRLEAERDYVGGPVSDRIDIGIAFLEMGLYDPAIRHFDAAVQSLTCAKEVPAEQLLSATSLLAYALILGRRPFDATIALQPPLRDSELPRESKLELIYLMGRAYEAMGKAEDSLGWYLQAAEIDPGYRDIEERLRSAKRNP